MDEAEARQQLFSLAFEPNPKAKPNHPKNPNRPKPVQTFTAGNTKHRHAKT
jgi:hypothetical protein